MVFLEAFSNQFAYFYIAGTLKDSSAICLGLEMIFIVPEISYVYHNLSIFPCTNEFRLIFSAAPKRIQMNL